jgi:AcrR family transcriptional regulator
MPDKSRLNVQKREPSGPPVKRTLDRRVTRTRSKLGLALRKLMEERPLEKISVRDVIKHAGVSRSAFYAHYDDKVDLLLSDMDQFLERMAMLLVVQNEQSNRIVPVREFFSHVGESTEIRGALARSERLQDFFDLAVEHFGRGIEARLKQLTNREPGSGRQSASERKSGRDLVPLALAGAFVSLLNAWTRTGQRQSPQSMDALFHQLAWTGLTRIR